MVSMGHATGRCVQTPNIVGTACNCSSRVSFQTEIPFAGMSLALWHYSDSVANLGLCVMMRSQGLLIHLFTPIHISALLEVCGNLCTY
jgi:hypothetical protein